MNLRHALLHSFLWRKSYFASYLILMAFCSLYFHFSPIKHPLLDASCMIASFIFCCVGLKSDTYSWKYFQALPFSKKELFHFHILNQFLVLLPVLIWVLAFFPFVMDLFSIPYKGMNVSLFGGTILLYVFGSLFTGIASFYQNFESIRAPYAKTSGLVPFLQTIRNAMYYTLGGGALALIPLGVIVLIASLISPYSESLASLFAVLAFSTISIFLYYWYVFRRWQREELSYTKINFRAYRDLPIMAGIAFSLSILPGLFERAPDFYGDSDLLEKLHDKDPGLYKKIYQQNLHSNGLHQKSGTGMTALMAAAHMGNLSLFEALEAAGAKREGTVKFAKSRNHHGMNILMLAIAGKNKEIVKRLLETENANSTNGKFSALNFAAYMCSPEIVDLLLEKGAKINSANEKGQTPLHIASRDNCFSVVVSLLEAGADPLIKDKTGKLARDYISKQYDRNRIGYYLEKKMRSPAGK